MEVGGIQGDDDEKWIRSEWIVLMSIPQLPLCQNEVVFEVDIFINMIVSVEKHMNVCFHFWWNAVRIRSLGVCLCGIER